jgi:diacylglycerol kinase (ATP)
MNDLSFVSRATPALVFVNPSAGGGRAQTYLPRIRKLFSARQFHAEFIFTLSAGELESQTRTAIDAGRRVLLAMGGDGTLQGLVNAAHGSNALLGILPIGGGNDFAAALGLPKNPVAAAEAILAGQPRCVDLLRARTADGRLRLYVGGGGLGLDAEAVHHAIAYRRVPGRLRYVAAALRALSEFAPLSVGAEFPGNESAPTQANVLLAAVLNTPTYGAGIRLAAEAQIDDGLLTAIFVRDLSVLRVLARVPRLVTRGDLRDSLLKRVSAERVRLTASRPCFFHGDGEILGPAPVEIEVVPRAIRILAPTSR